MMAWHGTNTALARGNNLDLLQKSKAKPWSLVVFDRDFGLASWGYCEQMLLTEFNLGRRGSPPSKSGLII